MSLLITRKRLCVRGFSLLELMMVVSIIGILTVVALPSYQTYAQKARFTEVISSVQAFKLAVSIALQQGTPLSELNNGTHGIPQPPKPTKNLTSILVENGIITATANELMNHATYILKPNAEGNLWTVSGSCLKSGLCHD